MLKEELNIIKQAILNEIEGYEFYQMAADQIGTGDSKEAFNELASEELKHVDYLEELFEKLKSEDKDNFKLAFEAMPPSPDIYNWEKLDKNHMSLAMSVFSVGMQMEKDSVDFYEAAKEKTNIDEAKRLYDLLIKWEKVHLEQFSEQYDIYKKGWWAEQGYAPF